MRADGKGEGEKSFIWAQKRGYNSLIAFFSRRVSPSDDFFAD